MAKKKNERPIQILMIVIICLLLSGSAYILLKNPSTGKTAYKTELDWADTTSYMCAVGVDGYNGDVLEAGMYAVTPTSVDSGAGKVPIVWDIYVSKNQYSRLSDLKTEEHKLTVGGINGDSGTVVLNNGDYLYIKYNEVAGTPTGILHMEKQ